MTPTDREALAACPFCGAGETTIKENGKVWTGMRWSEPASVSVQHWCAPEPDQPSRMIERVGRDEASAIAAWNRRATVHELIRRHGTTYDACRSVEAAASSRIAELERALRMARDCIRIDRTFLADSHMDPITNEVDEDGAAGLAEYDEVLAVIDAALSTKEHQA